MIDDYPLNILLNEILRKCFKRMLKLSVYYLTHDAFKFVCVNQLKAFIKNSSDFKNENDK